jgi:hypothetical protein
MITSDRATRAAMYSQWVKDDCYGLISQIDRPIENERQILLDARANVKAALDLIEHRLSQRAEV